VNDFADPESLSAYLHSVAKSEEKYASYLEWKYLPPSNHFKELVENSMSSPKTVCKLCEEVARLKELKHQ
jgi:hypothetical protein